MRVLIAALFALVVAICGTISVPALGDAPDPKRTALLESTVRFLQESQRENGGFASTGEPSQGTSAWVALALAAAGINPRNQAKPCSTDAYTYLVTHFRESIGEEIAASEAKIATTALERELLVVNASGTDPHDFAGLDLVREILERQLPNGSFSYLPGGAGQANTTIFAILALSPVEDPAVEPALTRAAGWLLAQQNGDGGWHWQGKLPVSEVDMTGAAIQALNAVGAPGVEAAQREGLEYLEGVQLPDGGFPAQPGAESNVASTAWAVQGIWSAGGNPETWRTGSGLLTEEPLDYMESMQQPDGHIRWSRSSDLNGVWMTAYVVPAFAGHELPIPEATYSEASRPPCDPKSGGASTGVIAGGGGKGAPLFSRPKPQSEGKTPGGARIVGNEGPRPRNRSRSRRGTNAEQPTGTETAEPRGTDAKDRDEVTAVSSSAGPGRGGGPGRQSAAGGREVSGFVIGDLSSASGELAFGAPGLRGAEDGGDPEPWAAIMIGGVALLVALSGARWERRHEEVLP